MDCIWFEWIREGCQFIFSTCHVMLGCREEVGSRKLRLASTHMERFETAREDGKAGGEKSQFITSARVLAQEVEVEGLSNQVNVSQWKLRTAWLVHLTDKSTSRQRHEGLKPAAPTCKDCRYRTQPTV